MIPAVFLGLVSVLQAGLNRRIGAKIGLPLATVMNNAVLLITSLALFLLIKFLSGKPLSAQPSAISGFPGWYLIPGALGLLLVAGIPYVISQIGAFRVFTPLILSQIVGSLLWDCFLEGTPVTSVRILGAIVTGLGVFLCQKSS